MKQVILFILLFMFIRFVATQLSDLDMFLINRAEVNRCFVSGVADCD